MTVKYEKVFDTLESKIVGFALSRQLSPAAQMQENQCIEGIREAIIH
ncbi:MAG: hypothetical protein JBO36_17665 [Candidatus Thiodiazotropha taylori]|nr:hypothetical protein [Candidatus Thiodiazotropha taylori]